MAVVSKASPIANGKVLVMLLSLAHELSLFVFVGAWYVAHVTRDYSRDVHDACVIGLGLQQLSYYQERGLHRTRKRHAVLFKIAAHAASTLAVLSLVSLVLNVVRICKVL